ncbi:PepSY domain-containing protein [Pleomorphomonas sp. JP5]|uniref:PepSY domain-containing protein n=1 Tax=Pleomorphomonas sp. JP5 TaxID=2942998 RepID=UPI0020437507|nr:PepSY domain-containing protein [Pleomorphomonas sp. JP5]MCM5557164.1 PepSY domain-containing protein [Pleomorphomonas sp. JP5]
MLRRFHSLPGVVLALFLMVIAVTGAVLSVNPALDRLANPAVTSGVSVAALAEAVGARHQEIDKIAVRPSGAVTVSYVDNGASGTEQVDPATGASLGTQQGPSALVRWMTELHRSLFLGDAGKIGTGVAALAMLALSLSGIVLLMRSLGGWRGCFAPVRGDLLTRLHGEVSRFAVVGLMLSSLTGLYMSADTFGLLPDPSADAMPAMVSGSGGPVAPVGSLFGLQSVPVADLRELTFPAKDDPTDVYTVVTTQGESSVDASSGAELAFTPASTWDRLRETVIMLHTGRGAWALGLLLGAASGSVPLLGVTGVLMWWRRRSSRPAIAANVAARLADTVILVGSEGNTTWGFAGTLHEALTASGHRVHTAPMNALSAAHLSTERMLILTATYGDGGAPASANAFLSKLDALDGSMPVAVLGFGDRSFPQFCRFAQDVSEAVEAKGWPVMMGLKRVDRQSAQEFAAWGRDLGDVLGHELTLAHRARLPKTEPLALVASELYGEAVGAPVAIMRFAPQGKPTEFEAGDILGVLPPGETMPRFYSLASSARDGFLEICVRLREGGVCSSYLHGLTPGDTIAAFVRTNPRFRPVEGKAPLILIGAGAGIGPLTGFVRANDGLRPVHLYWGGRSPSSDFLYEHELAEHLAEKRLTSLTTAFSRSPDGGYIQDRLAADAPKLRELIRHGAQVLVCGGRDMAEAVTSALGGVVRPLGLDLATLKSDGRYVEDVY